MPSLKPSIRRVEKLMTATCLISRAPRASAKAAMDPTTLTLQRSPDDTKKIYQGKCYVVRENRIGSGGMSDGTDQVVSSYFLGIPLASPILTSGLYVAVLTSTDPALVGRNFKITSTDAGEIIVWRSAHMELVESNRDG